MSKYSAILIGVSFVMVILQVVFKDNIFMTGSFIFSAAYFISLNIDKNKQP